MSEWVQWHEEYAPGQPLALRLGLVQDLIRSALDERPPGPIRVISMCAGDGRDLLGVLAGHPRRYADTTGVNFLAPLHSVHLFITIAAFITIGAQFIFVLNFFVSLRWGAKAADNPWNATTLEWSVPSPPPFDNFAGQVPHVYRGPYEFSVPGAKEDFIPQNLPPAQVARTR